MFQDNLTLALIPDKTWKSEYTYLYLRYFQRLINPSVKVVSYTSVDEALGSCSTDYLLVCRAGAFPFAPDFFWSLNNEEVGESLFVGKIKLESDYAVLKDELLLVNVLRWKDYGRPQFNSKVRQGPTFYTSIASDNPRLPLQIVKQSDEQIFVDHNCSSSGAEFITTELNKRGVCNALMQFCQPDDFYVFSTESPYHEIISETYFEKKYLPKVRSKNVAIDTDDLSSARQTTVGVVVAPAVGLKALTLAEHYKAKHIVIFSHNPAALELQKLIFGVERRTLYTDIIGTFYEGGNRIEPGWEEDEYAIISPLSGVKIEYHLVDPFSYEMDEFIKKLDFQSSMVFDFSDVYIRPQEYYKRTFAQVNGLFGQLYSYLKSRTGPTYLFGLSPNFDPLYENLVNISIDSFNMDPTVVPEEDEGDEEVELTQEMLDAAEQLERLGEVAIIRPELVLPEITAPIDTSPVLQQNTTSETPSPNVNYAPPAEQAETTKEPEMKLIELHESKKTDKDDDTKKDADKKEEKKLEDIAKDNGYEMSHKTDTVNGDKIKFTVFTKTEEFAELEYTASLEYFYNPDTGSWKFIAGKVDADKRVEFHNGEDEKSMIKHMERKTKFNPKTALQYF